jgi:hypothetical protein
MSELIKTHSTKAMVEELVRRGRAERIYVEPHDEYIIRTYPSGECRIQANGYGPVAILIVND